MFEKIIDAIIKALKSMVGDNNANLVADYNITTVSQKMKKSIDLWVKMYEDRPPWEDLDQGIISTGIPKQICEIITNIMLSEFTLTILDDKGKSSGELEETFDDKSNFTVWFQECLETHLLNKLNPELEKALATGGMIIKPYLNNGNLYFDFVRQGEFYPINYDDDGNITDIAFLDQFVSEKYLYTKVERQKFINNTIEVTNKAYRSKIVDETSTLKDFDLGDEIPLDSVEKWVGLEPEAVIKDIDTQLFGYYKVATANNVDMKSPLGMAVFSPARNLIIKADQQFCRLDWEYEGGQMAVDVDPTAIDQGENCKKSYWNGGDIHKLNNSECSISETTKELGLPQGRKRVFRQIDLGSDETYKVFAPSLRDNSYLSGYDRYKMEIEDRIGLSRGSMSSLESQARTATEITVLHQRAFRKSRMNQKSLETCLQDVIYAAWLLCKIYANELDAPMVAEYDCVIDWGDSVLVDKDAELEKKIVLCDKGVLSKAELRASYTGEDLEIAKQKIDEMMEEAQQAMMDNMFGANNNQEEDLDNEEENKDDDKQNEDEDNQSKESNWPEDEAEEGKKTIKKGKQK